MAENNTLQTVIVGGIAIWGIKKLSDIFGPGSPNDPKNDDAMSALDQEIANTPGTSNYTQAQFNSWAGSLQAAMEGMGTDENMIYSIIDKMQSKLDVLLLIKAFGIRYYKEFAMVGENYMLDQWFQNELSQGAIDDINETLQGKGINFYF